MAAALRFVLRVPPPLIQVSTLCGFWVSDFKFRSASQVFRLPSLLLTVPVLYLCLFFFFVYTNEHLLTHISVTLVFAQIGIFSDFFG